MTSSAAYYDLPVGVSPSAWRRGAFLTVIAGIHVGALAFAFTKVTRSDALLLPQAMTVRMLQETPPKVVVPKVEPAKPLPPAPSQPRKAVQPPPAILAAAPSAVPAPSFAVPPQPEPRPAEAPPAPPAPPPVVAARFDADYLQNPKPAYPPISRRMNEEGKVVLRVRVSAQGLALAVDVKQSSGYGRLDEAARSAVEKWRFVPARQGAEAVESWVLVPLTFKLDT